MFRYKTSSALSLLSSVGATVLSVVLVVKMEQNKLDGRIIGHVLPTVVIGLALYVLIAFKGKKIDFSSWKYALCVCLPYVPLENYFDKDKAYKNWVPLIVEEEKCQDIDTPSDWALAEYKYRILNNL